jgi:hypothetical protein
VAKKKKHLLLPQLPWLHPLLLLQLPPLRQLKLLHQPPRLHQLLLLQLLHPQPSKSRKKRSSNRFLPCATKKPLRSGFFVASAYLTASRQPATS